MAEWSYGHAELAQAEVWLGGTEYGRLSAGRRRLLPQERRPVQRPFRPSPQPFVPDPANSVSGSFCPASSKPLPGT
jgi:hypothetical protein